jgi:gliding motility-associated-like protein
MVKWSKYLLFVLFFLSVKPALHANERNSFCPVIDDKNISIIASSCNGNDGKILGMSGTGTGLLTFTWYDANNKIVGTQADLTNVPAGVYKVLLHDESKCLAVERDGYIVPTVDQVVINNVKTIIKSPDCNSNNGSITNIGFTNAVSFKWLDGANNIISTSADLTGVGTGSFTVIATNKEGCSEQSTYRINGTGLFPKISKVDTVNGLCGELSTLNITFAVTDKDPTYHYFLLDQNGTESNPGVIVYSPNQPTSIALKLTSGVKFTLISTDPHLCETVLGTYLLSQPAYYIDTSQVTIRNDACGNHTGAIVNLHMVGAHGPLDPKATKFKWTDGSGKVISQLLELTSIGAGTYTLQAIDGGGCTDTKVFTIKDSTINAVAPLVKNINLCLPGAAVISVDNVDKAGGYKLYDANNNFIRQDNLGFFAVNVTQTTNFFITHTVGQCESPATAVTVNVAAPNVIIPNTFTPNNDGINDYWLVKGLEQFPGTTVDIFNRNGELIYHSIGYGKPFDGLYSGKKLTVGVYYYIIDIHKPICLGKIAGSLTLIR